MRVPDSTPDKANSSPGDTICPINVPGSRSTDANSSPAGRDPSPDCNERLRGETGDAGRDENPPFLPCVGGRRRDFIPPYVLLRQPPFPLPVLRGRVREGAFVLAEVFARSRPPPQPSPVSTRERGPEVAQRSCPLSRRRLDMKAALSSPNRRSVIAVVPSRAWIRPRQGRRAGCWSSTTTS